MALRFLVTAAAVCSSASVLIAAPYLDVSTFASADAGMQSQSLPRSDTLNPALATDGLALPNILVSAVDGVNTAAANSGAMAEFGALHGYVSASAASPLPWTAAADASAEAHFRDTLTIQPSSGHPNGSSVPITLRLVVDCPREMTEGLVESSTRLETRLFVTNFQSTWQAGVDDIWDYRPQWDVTQTTRLDVGYTYTIGGDLKIAAAFTVQDAAPWDGTATLDVSNTAHGYIYSSDPTVNFITGSGFTYAVPEPTSLVALGPACLLVLRRKR